MSEAGLLRRHSAPILTSRSGGADRRLRLGVVAIALLALAACGPRPVGDFGRAAPSYMHDVAMPAAGRTFANARGEPVSAFNQTDEEKLMHDRIWRFLVAPHAKDWSFDFVTELQRTRITPVGSRAFGLERYYKWLRETHYQSSTVRYATLGQHILADIDTIPATFAAICAVVEVDRQRAEALAALSRLGPQDAAEARARKAENDQSIAWFVAMLNYRFQSYDYALDHLLVETPHAQSLSTDYELTRLARFVERANARDFCGDPTGRYAHEGAPLPSRYGKLPVDNEVIAIK